MNKTKKKKRLGGKLGEGVGDLWKVGEVARLFANKLFVKDF